MGKLSSQAPGKGHAIAPGTLVRLSTRKRLDSPSSLRICSHTLLQPMHFLIKQTSHHGSIQRNNEHALEPLLNSVCEAVTWRQGISCRLMVHKGHYRCRGRCRTLTPRSIVSLHWPLPDSSFTPGSPPAGGTCAQQQGLPAILTFHCAKPGEGELWNKVFIYAGNLHTKPPCSAYPRAVPTSSQLRWLSRLPKSTLLLRSRTLIMH